LDDPLRSGLPNLLAYAYGLDPTVPNPSALPKAGEQNGYLTLTYRQNKAATDLTYIVEAKGNMTTDTWNSSGTAEIDRQDKGTYWEVTVRDSVPLTGAASRFLHLKVTKP
jgi:hypothetical protein